MYESSFGLKRRPFAATPDASCFLSAGPVQAALDEMVVCVEQGQGIAVLTSPAGTGKTLLCERLRAELEGRFETVFLRHASFLTRRALLQTVLCELNHPYNQPSEQELRLELLPAIRALQPKREALVLICDEAHQLNDSLLEELRILADFAEAGRPLVRLVLVGQLSLEEKLAHPSLEAINQRIRAHITLSPFDLAGSLDYIDYRITWAGGRTDEVFTPQALNMIAHVSDGVPRCINQLADHSLLLAFVAEQRPVEEALVREALSDLRQLPLQWNESSPALRHSSSETESPALTSSTHDSSGFLTNHMVDVELHSFEIDSTQDTKIIELSPDTRHSLVTAFATSLSPAQVEQPNSIPSAVESHDTQHTHSLEIGSDDWRQTVELFNPQPRSEHNLESLEQLQPAQEDGAFQEERRVNLKYRAQFQMLLQNAYDAAEVPASNSNHQSQVASTASIADERPATIKVNSNPVTTAPRNTFEEEVIVDRYAAIDAGFAPPVVPVPDTTIAGQVHHQSTVARTEAAEPITSTQTVFRAESSSNWTPTDFRRTYQMESASALAVESTVEVAEPEQMSQVEIGSDAELFEEVSAQVYSLAETLRPTLERSSAEAILQTLKLEIGTVPAPIKTEEPATELKHDYGTGWEAVETPAPAPVAESRPFRYLFSMLRRKQHGLT